MADAQANETQKGFLGWVERTGNKLPDPVFIFFYLILALMVISFIAEMLGYSAVHPTKTDPLTGEPVTETAKSLLSADNLQKLWTKMPETFTHFHPLGYVLVVMLGAGVAERSGLFGSAIRAALRNIPKSLLTPMVALIAMLSNHAADAGYVVMIPLAAIIFASAGRHPLAGIACGFAGVSGGFSANIAPGQLDALLYGITEAAYDASSIEAGWTSNIAGNTYFIIALLLIYLPVIWYVTDKVIEPRLGKWKPDENLSDEYSDENKPLTDGQRKGLRHAGLAVLGVCFAWFAMAYINLVPGIDKAPLRTNSPAIEAVKPLELEVIKGKAEHNDVDGDGARSAGDTLTYVFHLKNKGSVNLTNVRIPVEEGSNITVGCSEITAKNTCQTTWTHTITEADVENADLPWYTELSPFFKSLVAGFMILFLAAGWFYGKAAGTIKNHRDLVEMMTEAMKDLGYYLVLAFAAAHFVAMFNWSNLGLITAVHGAAGIGASGLPLPIALGLIVLFSALLNLFVGSASAKWALLAPVMVPMLMLIEGNGISPDAATAVYRVGDGATNIITPLMVYFPLILVFAQRWKKDFGVGSLTAMMIPYSIWMLVTGVLLVMLWVYLGLDLGPGAPMSIDPTAGA